MKKKVVLKDNINNKTTKIEVQVRDTDHLAAQIKYPSRVFISKKKKEPKYKNKVYEESLF